MANKVVAKFKVQRIERSMWGKDQETQTIVLYPITGGSPENQQFFTSTPSGEIKLGTVNPEAAALFELNKEYYVEFTPAESEN